MMGKRTHLFLDANKDWNSSKFNGLSASIPAAP